MVLWSHLSRQRHPCNETLILDGQSGYALDVEVGHGLTVVKGCGAALVGITLTPPERKSESMAIIGYYADFSVS
jgi:hypothetical protein